MKIVHIPHAYHPVMGGAEIICKRISENLAAEGHDVRVVTTNVGAVQGYYEFGISRVSSRKIETIEQVKVVRLPFIGALYQLGGRLASFSLPKALNTRLSGRIMGLLRRRLVGMIAGQIAEICPDVVMAMPHLVVNVQAVLAARRRISFPLVMVPMLHEHDPNWDIPAMSRALRSADAVITLTSHEANRLVEAYGVPPDKVFNASVGIDVGTPAPPFDDRPNRVVFLGRKVKSKGIGDLIEAMRIVWAVFPNTELCIAGVRLPETLEIDRQIARLPDHWRQQVKDIGTVVDGQKSALLQSARCLVLPSKTESFGMVILDAWAHATPVVTWKLPVFCSIIEDGVTGLLVDSHGGPSALAEAILQILENPDEAGRMGMSGYKVAASTYSWSNVATTYLDAYQYAVRTASPHVARPS
jgi:glycosyltransferase involved in cell wall biosynthesis